MQSQWARNYASMKGRTEPTQSQRAHLAVAVPVQLRGDAGRLCVADGALEGLFQHLGAAVGANTGDEQRQNRVEEGVKQGVGTGG